MVESGIVKGEISEWFNHLCSPECTCTMYHMALEEHHYDWWWNSPLLPTIMHMTLPTPSSFHIWSRTHNLRDPPNLWSLITDCSTPKITSLKEASSSHDICAPTRPLRLPLKSCILCLMFCHSAMSRPQIRRQHPAALCALLSPPPPQVGHPPMLATSPVRRFESIESVREREEDHSWHIRCCRWKRHHHTWCWSINVFSDQVSVNTRQSHFFRLTWWRRPTSPCLRSP